jgi:hypothetical protein
MVLNTQEMGRLGLTKIGVSAPIWVLFGVGPSYRPEAELRWLRIQPHVDLELGQLA